MASIRGFGRYLPDAIRGNTELAQLLDCSPDWIRTMSGIGERRVAAPDQTVGELARLAAVDCLKRANMAASEVKLVLVSSGSGEKQFPGPAAWVAKELGMADIPAIDLPIASAGSLFGMSLASQLTPIYGPVLVIASEKMAGPALAEPPDKNIAILFGDGAGACLITPSGDGLKIIDSVLHSDGTFSDELRMDLDSSIRMNGFSVIMQASRKIPSSILELLERNHTPAQSVTAFLMHQANQNLIDRVAKAVGVGPDKFFSNIERYGNTSSASLFIAASEWMEQHPLKSGDTVCFAAFGAGFHWGALLARQQ